MRPGQGPSTVAGAPFLPFKASAARRHHIPKQRHRVTNWAVYEAGLRARGSLTVWFTAEAIEAWKAEPRTGRGGQPRYSDLAIATALTLRTVFRLALRQIEGLMWRREHGCTRIGHSRSCSGYPPLDPVREWRRESEVNDANQGHRRRRRRRPPQAAAGRTHCSGRCNRPKRWLRWSAQDRCPGARW